MTPLAHFKTRNLQGIPVVEAVGEIDLNNILEFERALATAAKADRGVVIAALNGVSYFDSKGLGVLMRFAERLALTRQQFLVVAPQGTVPRRILNMIAAEQAFPLFDSAEEAAAAATHRQASPGSPLESR